MIRSVSNNIIYNNESKIKKLHCKNRIKEIIIPIISQTKYTENEDKINEEFDKNNKVILSHRDNSFFSNNYYPIQEKIIVLKNRDNHFDEEKKNDLSQTMDCILLNKIKEISNLKVENKEKIEEKDIIKDSNKTKKKDNNNLKLNNIKIDKNILYNLSNLELGKNQNNFSKSKKLYDNNIINEKNKINKKNKYIYKYNSNKHIDKENIDENIIKIDNKNLDKNNMVSLNNNNNIIQKQNNFSFNNNEKNKQIIDMKQFSFGKKKENKKLEKRLTKDNINNVILNDTLSQSEINEVNFFIKYLFNIIGISYELNKISSNMNFNDLTFLDKKDLESLGFGIISRNRLCNIVKNFSKFLKDKKENFDLSNNNKNLKYLYEFLSKNKEIIVEKNIFNDLEKNYSNFLIKKKNFLDSQFKKAILNKIEKNNSNVFPIKTLNRNKSMIESFILDDKNYNVTKSDFNKSKLYNNDSKSNFKKNRMKLYNAYYKLNKEVDKYFNKEKERVLFSLRKIEQI